MKKVFFLNVLALSVLSACGGGGGGGESSTPQTSVNANQALLKNPENYQFIQYTTDELVTPNNKVVIIDATSASSLASLALNLSYKIPNDLFDIIGKFSNFESGFQNKSGTSSTDCTKGNQTTTYNDKNSDGVINSEDSVDISFNNCDSATGNVTYVFKQYDGNVKNTLTSKVRELLPKYETLYTESNYILNETGVTDRFFNKTSNLIQFVQNLRPYILIEQPISSGQAAPQGGGSSSVSNQEPQSSSLNYSSQCDASTDLSTLSGKLSFVFDGTFRDFGMNTPSSFLVNAMSLVYVSDSGVFNKGTITLNGVDPDNKPKTLTLSIEDSTKIKVSYKLDTATMDERSCLFNYDDVLNQTAGFNADGTCKGEYKPTTNTPMNLFEIPPQIGMIPVIGAPLTAGLVTIRDGLQAALAQARTSLGM